MSDRLHAAEVRKSSSRPPGPAAADCSQEHRFEDEPRLDTSFSPRRPCGLLYKRSRSEHDLKTMGARGLGGQAQGRAADRHPAAPGTARVPSHTSEAATQVKTQFGRTTGKESEEPRGRKSMAMTARHHSAPQLDSARAQPKRARSKSIDHTLLAEFAGCLLRRFASVDAALGALAVSGSRRLEEEAFRRCAARLGFSGDAKSLFQVLDVTNAGSIGKLEFQILTQVHQLANAGNRPSAPGPSRIPCPGSADSATRAPCARLRPEQLTASVELSCLRRRVSKSQPAVATRAGRGSDREPCDDKVRQARAREPQAAGAAGRKRSFGRALSSDRLQAGGADQSFQGDSLKRVLHTPGAKARHSAEAALATKHGISNERTRGTHLVAGSAPHGPSCQNAHKAAAGKAELPSQEDGDSTCSTASGTSSFAVRPGGAGVGARVSTAASQGTITGRKAAGGVPVCRDGSRNSTISRPAARSASARAKVEAVAAAPLLPERPPTSGGTARGTPRQHQQQQQRRQPQQLRRPSAPLQLQLRQQHSDPQPKQQLPHQEQHQQPAPVRWQQQQKPLQAAPSAARVQVRSRMQQYEKQCGPGPEDPQQQQEQQQQKQLQRQQRPSGELASESTWTLWNADLLSSPGDELFSQSAWMQADPGAESEVEA